MIKNNNISNNSNDQHLGRKTLLERLASLRIQPNHNSTSSSSLNTSTKAPESPRYIPRSTQSTQSKFYNKNCDSNDLPSSPSIGRRRKLQSNVLSSSSASSSNSNLSKVALHNTASPIDSPKYFPKQKVFDELEKVPPINFVENVLDSNVTEVRRHSATEVVTSFIDSFSILNNSLTLTTSKLELQNMNSSFAALQMDLKAAVSTISDLKSKLNDATKQAELNQEIKAKNVEVEEQLKIALEQISEIKIALEKEKEKVEFLQNYMEEVIQLKDEGEQKILALESQMKNVRESKDLLEENENLKETIKLLELKRLSSKSEIETSSTSTTSSEDLHLELKQKQAEIDKLRGREQHFKESNEIFQQKLILLTEENRKLRGQRPLNHY